MTTAEQLAAVLGDDAFRRLTHALGGLVVRIPTIAAANRLQECRHRDELILQLLNCQCGDERHHSYRAIARQFGVSARTVVRIGKHCTLPLL